MHTLTNHIVNPKKIKVCYLENDSYNLRDIFNYCLKNTNIDYKHICPELCAYLNKENIQILSNILKDADALDRNRIKVFKFAQCNPNYLRTNEAKEIYYISNIFLKKYKKTKI